MDFAYRHILKPILFLFDPEFVHNVFIYFGRLLGGSGLGRYVTRLLYGYHGRDISEIVDGIKYTTPFLLSAGFDYNAQLMRILPEIGLGGDEIGSITSKPCSGNPSPRMTRLPKSRSILVNKGLKNDGVDKIIDRLRAYSNHIAGNTAGKFIVGISIARTNDQSSASIESGIDDYTESLRKLNENDIGDYYAINISCPNAFGGEAFVTPQLLERLLSALDQIQCKKPMYVKMPINIPWEHFQSLLKIIDLHGLQGVIIGNLNKDYSSLPHKDEVPPSYCGGLSGLPTKDLTTELIRKTKEIYRERFTVIGVGGVMSWDDAKEKFEAGADLVQLITGMIYEGPGLIKSLCKGYARWKSGIEHGSIPPQHHYFTRYP